MGHRTAEQKPAGVDAGDQVGAGHQLCQRVGHHSEPVVIGQNRGQIAKEDPGLGKSGTLRVSAVMTAARIAAVGRPGIAAHSGSSRQRSIFHPAPHLVGLASTPNIFLVEITVRCWRYSGRVGMSSHSSGAASPSRRACSGGVGGHRQRRDDAVDLGLLQPDRLFAVAGEQRVVVHGRGPVETAARRSPMLDSSTSI